LLSLIGRTSLLGHFLWHCWGCCLHRIRLSLIIISWGLRRCCHLRLINWLPHLRWLPVIKTVWLACLWGTWFQCWGRSLGLVYCLRASKSNLLREAAVIHHLVLLIVWVVKIVLHVKVIQLLIAECAWITINWPLILKFCAPIHILLRSWWLHRSHSLRTIKLWWELAILVRDIFRSSICSNHHGIRSLIILWVLHHIMILIVITRAWLGIIRVRGSATDAIIRWRSLKIVHVVSHTERLLVIIIAVVLTSVVLHETIRLLWVILFRGIFKV
jgi:hypothetical protein